MKDKINFIIFFFVIFLITCVQQKELKIVNLENILENKTNYNLSNIADNILYIPLEIVENSFISSIQELLLIDTNIIIWDLNNTISRVLLFDIKGHFVKQIGQNGNGPGEYGQISDMCFDQKNEELLIITNNKRNILRYSLHGDFRGLSIKINDHTNVQYFGNRYYCHYPSNLLFFNKDIPYQLSILDDSGKVLNEQYPVNKNANGYLNPFIEFATFSIANKTLFYHVPKSNILYKITDTIISPKTIYDLGKYSFPEEYKWDFNGTQKSKTLNLAYIKSILSAKDKILIQYSKKGEPGLIIHENKNIINTGEKDKYGIKDDIDGLGYITNLITQDSILIDYIPVVNIFENDIQNSNYSEKIKDIIKHLQPNDNPIIRVISLK